MAFNKSKALENALKYLNQGKPAQAIAEYQLILRNDPKDQATLMTVGDLFARQGDMTQAIEYFERLAQVYLNDGFNSKAIAIYKKIAKLAPNELAPLERLADLYVQQGVLSEARPLFLQIAEAHLKVNRAPKAVEVLHRLLEVEPENLRVQMRLAELYNVMGQKKEAADTYLGYAQRLFDRGEVDEAQKLVDRALEVDSHNATALLLKARALGAANNDAAAIAALSIHPEAEAGGEVTKLLVDLELRSGQIPKALDIARKQLARGHAQFGLMHRIADTLIENHRPEEAYPLLTELRDPMIEAGEQDRFLKSLTEVTQGMPGRIEPLEMLVDYCRTVSDPFRLNAALGQLSDAYAAAGNAQRAEALLEELVDRNKNDERLVERLNQLRARNGTPQSAAPTAVLEPQTTEETRFEEAPAPPPLVIEEPLDEETQKYIAQALTDVDLFSSYGLTQKATHLLENVLQRAPRHTPTLERLLDLYLGAGNERRTAELAAQLEQIHEERHDHRNAERFAELRLRFQNAAGLTAEELPPAPPAAPVAQAATEAAATAEPPAPAVSSPKESAAAPASGSAAPQEFEIPLAAPEPEPGEIEASAEPAAVSPVPEEGVSLSVAEAGEPAAAGEEVDLSDEWEAISQEVVELPEDTTAHSAPVAPPAPVEEEPVHTAAAESHAPVEPANEEVAELPAEIVEIPEEVHASAEPEAHAAPPAEEAVIELIEEPAEDAPAAETMETHGREMELELVPETPAKPAKGAPQTTDDFISDLVAEVEGFDAPQAETHTAQESRKPRIPEPVTSEHAPSISASAEVQPPAAASAAPEPSADNLNQLAEVFQEFRSELGELGEDQDEDLETHYNLGIAYREMGLLDEAIGEFQKVAKAVQKGKPFAYTMNCSALLALSFMDKGEPQIAAVWYQNALEVPGLDHEAIMALRYDLGVALESAGESNAALDSFRKVYALNIDYRDVADRIATLQKH
ncbi:MAG TPA: tetratricopeptide repeat protein [Candidatus Acidoferrales bacterium]|jgi:tetratricopeptide (TPR) repeat protein